MVLDDMRTEIIELKAKILKLKRDCDIIVKFSNFQIRKIESLEEENEKLIKERGSIDKGESISVYHTKDIEELEANYQEAVENIEAIKHKLDKGLGIKYIKNFVNIVWEELNEC